MKPDIAANTTIIEELLLSTKREGMDKLIEHMKEHGFFTSPGSTRFHGCYKGGLAVHSIGVYEMLVSFAGLLRLECPADSLIIAPLLHDLCKMGAYIGEEKPYTYNRSQPKGHAVLSITRISRFIKLTDLEDKMIRYHMGVYGLVEFDGQKGEYPLRGGGLANAWHHHPVVKVMYFCDELATLEEKADEEPPCLGCVKINTEECNDGCPHSQKPSGL